MVVELLRAGPPASAWPSASRAALSASIEPADAGPEVARRAPASCAGSAGLVLDLDHAAHGEEPVERGGLDRGRQVEAADSASTSDAGPPG